MCYSSFCVCAREYFWALSFMPFTIFLVQHSISQQQKRFGWIFFPVWIIHANGIT